MPSSIITADIFSALFLIIILCSEFGNMSKQSAYFRTVTQLTLIGLVLHAVEVILTEYVLYSSNLILEIVIILLSMAIMVLFAYYLTSVISEKRPTSPWQAHSVMIVEIVCAVAVVTMVIIEVATTGEVYSFSFGKIFFTMFITQALCSLYMISIVIARSRLFDKRSAISLIIYLVLPFVTLIVRFFVRGFDYMMSALGLSLAIVYLGLQNSQLIEFKIREQIYNSQPVSDELTGLGSKRAFLDLKKTILSRELVGIVSISLNELKHINDTLGDTAGDEMLQQIALLIKENFSRYDSFRVSGDKFYVLVTSEEVDVFKSAVIDFMKDMNAYDQLASVGSSFGLGKDIDDLIRDADKIMYENKRLYYEQKSHDRRAARR